MSLPVQHTRRFDAAGKLDADDWLLLPPAELRSNIVLDAALADAMVQRYFELVARSTPLPLRVESDANGVRVLVPLGKTAIVYAQPEQLIDGRRAETSWQIAGGFLLAHGATYGGRFYLGAEWQPDRSLKLYGTIRRFPPRLVGYLGVSRGAAVYDRTQGRLHHQVMAQFLDRIAAQLTNAN